MADWDGGPLLLPAAPTRCLPYRRCVRQPPSVTTRNSAEPAIQPQEPHKIARPDSGRAHRQSTAACPETRVSIGRRFRAPSDRMAQLARLHFPRSPDPTRVVQGGLSRTDTGGTDHTVATALSADTGASSSGRIQLPERFSYAAVARLRDRHPDSSTYRGVRGRPGLDAAVAVQCLLDIAPLHRFYLHDRSSRPRERKA